MRHYERLDAAISQRRLERGLSWGELAAQLGVSESALRNIRRGRNEPSELTARRIEDALRWEPGSVGAVLNGGDPTPIGIPSPPGLDRDQLRDALRKFRQAADDLERLIGDQSD